MKIHDGKVTLSDSILHLCGFYLNYRIEVTGEDATVTHNEGRFTFTSYFALAVMYWKAHATRVTRCPACKMALPKTVAEWDDNEFQQNVKSVR